MKARTRAVLSLVLTLPLALGYSIFDAILPAPVPNRMLVKMSLWTLTLLVGYSLYALVTIRRPVPHSVRWEFKSTRTPFVLAVTVLLAGLGVLLPSPRHKWTDMLYILIMAVIGEEVLFRGLLWDLLDGWTGSTSFLGLSGTIWLTALAFGVMHLQYHHFLVTWASTIQVTYSFGVGVILGVIREQTNSVVSAALTHSAFNSLLNLFLAALH